MKNDEGLFSFLVGLISKKETKAPMEDPNDFDSEYYKGDYDATRKAVAEQEKAEDEEIKAADPKPKPQPKETKKDDVDDFGFVEDGEVTTDYNFNDDRDDAVDEGPFDDGKAECDDEKKCSSVAAFDNATLHDASAIADAFLDGSFIAVDVANTPNEEKIRMFDFLSGVVYATNGKIEKIQGGRTVIVLPSGCDMEDFKDACKNMKENN